MHLRAARLFVHHRSVATALALVLAMVIGGAMGDSGNGNNASPGVVFTYDALHRLVSVQQPNGSLTVYQYDAAGNRIQVSHAGAGRTGAIVASISPNLVWQGSTRIVTLLGTGLDGIQTAAVSGPGVTAAILGPSTVSQVRLSISATDDAAIGPRDLTLSFPTGMLVVPAGLRIAAAVAGSIAPAEIHLPPGMTQTFSAQFIRPGANGADTGTSAVWSIDGNSRGATIGPDGTLTMPATGLTGDFEVVVRATDPVSGATATAKVGLLAPEISVEPGEENLLPGKPVNLTAAVANAGTSSVTWSLPAGAPGTLTSSGLKAVYTAPAQLAAARDVVITVTSSAGPFTGKTTVHLVPVLALQVTPPKVNVSYGSTVSLQATAKAPLSTIDWTLVGASNNSGKLTVTQSVTNPPVFSATYTAPTTADPNASGVEIHVVGNKDRPNEETVIVPVAFSLVSVKIATPTTSQLRPNQSVKLQATVTGAQNTSVTWSVGNGPGSIAADGTYTAPAQIAPGSSVTVTATSVADPTQSDSVVLRLEPALSIAITPSPATAQVGDTVSFSAQVTGAFNDPSVKWSLLSGPGSIDAKTGVYSTGASVNGTPTQAVVVATSNEDPTVSQQAKVTIPAVAISVDKTEAWLHPGQSVPLQYTVSGTSDTAVTLDAPSAGTATSSGYTAPSTIPTAADIQVTAHAHAAPDKTAVTLVHLLPHVVVTLTSPPTAASPGSNATSISLGASLKPVVTVKNAHDPSVAFNTGDFAGGTLGTLGADGTYTAPSQLNGTPQTVTLTATSVEDPAGAGSLAVTLGPVAISVSAADTIVPEGGSVTLTSTVTGALNTGTAWSIASGSVGSVTSAGVFTAPAKWSQSTTAVVGTAIADPSKQATQPLLLVHSNSFFLRDTTSSQNSTVSIPLRVYGATGLGGVTMTLTVAPKDPTASRDVVRISGISSPSPAVQVSPAATASASRSMTLKQTYATPIKGNSQIAVVTLAVPSDALGAYSLTISNVALTDGNGSPVGAGDLNNGLVTVTGQSPSAIAITVNPKSASVVANGTQAFSATVTNTSDTIVHWSVQEGSAGGSIDDNGLYRAPSQAGTYHVVATSDADPRVAQLATVSVTSATPVLFGANLIVNPGADQGLPNSNVIPGWTTSTGILAVPYSTNTSTAVVSAIPVARPFAATPGGPGSVAGPNSPGPPASERGPQLFYGGSLAQNSNAFQSVDVSAGSSKIDLGTVTFALKGYLGGYANEDDGASLLVVFKDSTGGFLGNASLSQVRAIDRNNVTGMLLRSANGTVPAGTRTIEITLNMNYVQGPTNDAEADDLSLVLTAG